MIARALYLTIFAGCAVIASHPAQAEIPGRLFFTQQQRLLLDNNRRQNMQSNNKESATSSGVTFSGIVKRSDGRTIVWVNGRPVDSAEATHFGSLKAGSKQGQPVLSLPYPGQAVDLKVGQSLDPLSGKAVEAFASKPKADAKASSSPAESSSAQPADKFPPAKNAPAPGVDSP